MDGRMHYPRRHDYHLEVVAVAVGEEKKAGVGRRRAYERSEERKEGEQWGGACVPAWYGGMRGKWRKGQGSGENPNILGFGYAVESGSCMVWSRCVERSWLVEDRIR